MIESKGRIKNMKYYEVKNNKITALSALKRRTSAPQLVVVAPSGSGKSTLVYFLLNNKLVPYLKIGIGDKSQTTIIPCEFCLDERISNEDSFAIQIIKKDYTSKDIHLTILTVLMDLFGKNDCDPEETIDAFDEDIFKQIIEPEGAMYHLGSIRDKLSLDKLKRSWVSIFDYMIDNGFSDKVKFRKNELKNKKVKLSEIRESIFEEMFEEMPLEVKMDYITWLKKIGLLIGEMLHDAIGEELFSEKMVQYSITDNEIVSSNVLSELFNPQAPYSLVIDQISIACRPRDELIAKKKVANMPFRFCIRDTMGLTQKGIDAASTKDALEIALNCKADTVLFLMSLEERDDVLRECCKALMEKKNELKRRGNLDTAVYVLFTKADRIVENLINKCNKGELYINEKTYIDNIHPVLSSIESMVADYANMIPQEEVGWISMRYVEDSYLLKSLKGDPRMLNFEPKGLFERITDFSLKTLQRTLPSDINNPLFVTPIDPDAPAICVSINKEQIRAELQKMQLSLSEYRDIVNGYIINDKTPRLHGRSVSTYWYNLTVGLGHTTRASVYGNFSINMKGLLKRMLSQSFGAFDIFDKNAAITFTADNLNDNALQEVMSNLLETNDIAIGLNPALGDRNICLQRLYEFYKEYFRNPSRFAFLIDQVAYDMSYGNKEIKQKLINTYNSVPGYDGAMRKLQATFQEFFKSDDFARILIEEFESVMMNMANKIFITI